MDLDVGFAGAFLAGLLSFASPCVLPLVLPYLSFIAGVSIEQLTEDQRTRGTTMRILLTALMFVAGFSTVFVGLGASASYFGNFLSEYLVELGYIAGVLILVLGLHFLGVFRVGVLFREARFNVSPRRFGLFGAYVVGLAFAFGWTPCVGPVLAAILIYAGSEADVSKGAMLLFFYSAGIGLPFIIAAIFASPFTQVLNKNRRHMGKVEKVTGIILVVTGLLFLTNSMSTISYWLLELFPVLATIG